MPEQFDERWEYYVPDPEIAELIGSNTGVLDIPYDETSKANPRTGFRFSSGTMLDNPLLYQKRELSPVSTPNLKACKKCGFLYSIEQTSKYCSRECGKPERIDYPPRDCLKCGAEFVPFRNRQRFCTIQCARTHIRIARPQCLQCGITFVSYRDRGRYCSRECWREHRREARKRDCPRCGIVFYPDAKSDSRYCSLKCGTAGNGRTRVLPDYQCRHCKSSFRPTHGGMKYCSKFCVSESQRLIIHDTGCKACGKVLEKSTSNNGIPRKYCSRKCRLKVVNHNYRQRTKGVSSNG